MAEHVVQTAGQGCNDYVSAPESKSIEQTIKRAVRAAYTTGRELGLTEDQIQALGNGIKEICTKYMEEQTRPKITREGNLHWTKDQLDAMRTLRWSMETRLRVDLARCGAGQKVIDVMRESCSESYLAVRCYGNEQPHENKTPVQQAYSNKARVIDIGTSWYVKRATGN